MVRKIARNFDMLLGRHGQCGSRMQIEGDVALMYLSNQLLFLLCGEEFVLNNGEVEPAFHI